MLIFLSKITIYWILFPQIWPEAQLKTSVNFLNRISCCQQLISSEKFLSTRSDYCSYAFSVLIRALRYVMGYVKVLNLNFLFFSFFFSRLKLYQLVENYGPMNVTSFLITVITAGFLKITRLCNNFTQKFVLTCLVFSLIYILSMKCSIFLVLVERFGWLLQLKRKTFIL